MKRQKTLGIICLLVGFIILVIFVETNNIPKSFVNALELGSLIAFVFVSGLMF